jgi:hypothetical protein
MSKKKEKPVDVDRQQLLADLRSPDEHVRAHAAASLCPCHRGWELFEDYVDIVSQLTRDSSAAVRAKALHVFDDAALIQSIGDAEYRFQSVEDRLRSKRAPRFGSDEVEVEVRRSDRFKKRKGTFVLR